MKKIAILIFSVLAFTSAAFAQSSYTSTSTLGLFKNDTDNFMNVNAWQTVKPENFFGTLSYSNGLALGAAKQFDNFYLGLYGNGKLTDFTVTDDKKGKVKTTTTSGTDSFNFSALVGLENIGGIKASVYFKPAAVNGFEKTDSDTVTVNKYTFTTDLSYGFNTEKDGKKLTPRFSLKLADTKDKEEDTAANTLTDNSYATLTLGGGTGIVFPSEGIVENTLDLDGSASFRFYPTETAKDVKEKGRSYVGFGFTPAYICEIKPVDKLSIRLKTSLAMTMSADATASEINGVSVDDALRTKFFDFGIAPDLRFGVQYALKPSFIINGGASFDMGSLTFESGKTGDDKDSTWTFKDDNRRFYNYFGFEWKPMGGKLSLDCYYDLVWDIFNDDFTSDFSTGSVDMWNNVNKALVHNVNIKLSVKF